MIANKSPFHYMENLEEITAKTDTDPQQWIGSGVCVCVCVVSHEY